ncbi:MAG: potassium/proton antiporter [Elusimicrobia bacterium]|nr:potassium/proton antiporter [Elusimicrobiota bacterium]
MLFIISLILIFIIFFSLLFKKVNIPLILISLASGMIFGSDILGIIYFDNVWATKEIAEIALIFILFAGGYGIKKSEIKPVIKISVFLSTFGVFLTALSSALIFAFLSGWNFWESFLLCAIISSTDAAACFSILNSNSVDKRLTSIIKTESASNDPAAIILTTFIVNVMAGISQGYSKYFALMIWQMAGGIAVGILIGYLGVFLFRKIRELDISYSYILLAAVSLLSFSAGDMLKTSGILSVFFAGIVIGNEDIPYKNMTSSFAEILSFISNIVLFIMLGLLVFPKKFALIWKLGLLLFFVTTFIGRPLVIFISSIFEKTNLREKIFLSLSGIKGSVPIVLATYPLSMGMDPEHKIFNIIFFAVTISVIFQGVPIAKFAQLLKLTGTDSKKKINMMKLVNIHDNHYDLIEVFIDDEIYSGEFKISDIILPMGTTITMINRDNSIIAPSGKTLIRAGDVLFILAEKEKIKEVTDIILNKFGNK